MSAKISLNGKEYTILNMEWKGEIKEVIELLTDMTEDMDITPDKGDPDCYAAREVVRILGGKMVEEKPQEYDPNTIY